MGTYTAFAQHMWLATGTHEEIIAALRAMPDLPRSTDLLIFDDRTGRQVDLDLRDNTSAAPLSPPRGRPRIGVKAREVTLLPRHWQWLADRPGGASAEIRRLVELAMAAPLSPEAGRDAAYRFLSAIAGDLPGYEEAIRALYRDDRAGFDRATTGWAAALRDHARGFAWPEC